MPDTLTAMADRYESRVTRLETLAEGTQEDIRDLRHEIAEVRSDVSKVLSRFNQLMVAVVIGCMALIGNGVILLLHK